MAPLAWQPLGVRAITTATPFLHKCAATLVEKYLDLVQVLVFLSHGEIQQISLCSKGRNPRNLLLSRIVLSMQQQPLIEG